MQAVQMFLGFLGASRRYEWKSCFNFGLPEEASGQKTGKETDEIKGITWKPSVGIVKILPFGLVIFDVFH